MCYLAKRCVIILTYLTAPGMSKVEGVETEVGHS